jgi:DNA modification methylase
MQAIVRDYSIGGDLICDPYAGTGTSLVAAASEGRRSVGAEIDPDTFATAQTRIAGGYTPSLFAPAAKPRQGILL